MINKAMRDKDFMFTLSGAIELLQEICEQIESPNQTVIDLLTFGLEGSLAYDGHFEAGYESGLINGMALVLGVENEELISKFLDEVEMIPDLEKRRLKLGLKRSEPKMLM